MAAFASFILSSFTVTDGHLLPRYAYVLRICFSLVFYILQASFTKTIIPLVLVGYDLILTNSVPRAPISYPT